MIPFMLVLGATGIIYLFKPQLDNAMYRNLLFVPPGSSLLSYTEQVEDKCIKAKIVTHLSKEVFACYVQPTLPRLNLSVSCVHFPNC